jgi:hypothetical protein
LQQNLSQEQAQILVMQEIIQIDDSTFGVQWHLFRNKVLYRKTVFNAVEIFEYSNDAQQELFNVRFTLVGNWKLHNNEFCNNFGFMNTSRL